MWRPVAILIDELIAFLVGNRCLWPRGKLSSDPVLLSQVPWPPPQSLEEFYGQPQPADLRPIGEPRRAHVAGVLYQDYEFTGQLRAGFDRVNRGLARRWWHPGRELPLAVLMLPGLAQFNFFWFDRMGQVLAACGLDAWMMDEPYNHRRTPPGFCPSQLIAGGPPRQLLAAFCYAARDATAVIRALQARGRRVILIGQSFGAWLSTMLALLHDDLAAVFPVTPMGDVVRWYRSKSTLSRMGRRHTRISDRELLQHIARPVNPAAWPPPRSAQRVHFHISVYDRFLDPHLALRLARSWNSPYTLHREGHASIWLGARLRRLLREQIVRTDAFKEAVAAAA